MNIDFIDRVKSYLNNLVIELNKKVYVDNSWMKCAGKGLFANNEFQTGDIIVCYSGVIYDTNTAIKLQDKSYLMRLGPKLYVDARESPLILARYINDCRNVAGYNVIFDKIESKKCAMVRATRPIYKGEEIFVDYGKWYWAGVNIVNKDKDGNGNDKDDDNEMVEQRLSFADLNRFRSQLDKFEYH